MFTRESISKELRRINESVPQLLRDNTLIETAKTPEMKLVFEKAVEDENLSQEMRDKAKHLLDTGIFDKKKIVENPKVAKQRDDWVAREIKKAIKEGRLPNKKQARELGLDKLHD
jgi:hypothetical protein